MFSRVKMQRLRLLLVFEASIFVLAALVHVGIFSAALRYSQAFVIELLLAVILMGGLGASLNWPRATRDIAVFVHSGAVLVALTGVILMAMGEGATERAADLVFHVLMLLMLIRGFLTSRKPIAEVF